MKRVTPIGYSKSSMGKALFVMTALIGGLMVFAMVQGGAPLSAMAVPIVVIAVLAVLFLLADLGINKKNKSKIEHMDYLLSCPAVSGELKEIKEIPYFLFKEYEEMPVSDGKVYIKGKHRVFRLVVTFISPVTGCQETVVSPSYGYSVTKIKDAGQLLVHYSPDGEYWIEAK